MKRRWLCIQIDGLVCVFRKVCCWEGLCCYFATHHDNFIDYNTDFMERVSFLTDDKLFLLIRCQAISQGDEDDGQQGKPCTNPLWPVQAFVQDELGKQDGAGRVE